MSSTEEPTGADLVGKTLLGKLDVKRVLGAGGMGAVYEVEHRITRHRRALKLLHPEYAQNAEVVARFLREASVAGTLRTKYVVETFDAGQLEDGSPYVLMEMLVGEPLSAAIERGALSPGHIATIVWEACEGLAVAHEAGIIHRDLKPDNLFLSRDEEDGTERVKLLDFGISKFTTTHDYAGTLTTDGAMMGTPFYMSPEQAQGAHDVDERADVYALGVILYETIAGRPPFVEDTFSALVIKIHQGEYAPLVGLVSDLDPSYAAIIERAMHRDRDERHPTVRDLQEALRPFSDRELPVRHSRGSGIGLEATMAQPSEVPAAVTAAPTPFATESVRPPAEPAERSRSRMPVMVGAALGVVGLAAVGVAMTVGLGGEEPEAPEEALTVDEPVAQPPTAAAAQPVVAAHPDAGAPVPRPDAGPLPTSSARVEPSSMRTNSMRQTTRMTEMTMQSTTGTAGMVPMIDTEDPWSE